MGGAGDAEASRFERESRRSSAVPVGREDVALESAFHVLHDGREPRLRHRYWQTHWSCFPQRGDFRLKRLISVDANFADAQLRKAIEDVNARGFVQHSTYHHENNDIELGNLSPTNEEDERKHPNGTPPRSFNSSKLLMFILSHYFSSAVIISIDSRTDLSSKDGSCDSDSDDALDYLGPGRSSVDDRRNSYHVESEKRCETRAENDSERQNLLDQKVHL